MFTTYTGKNVSLSTLEVKDICLQDIAHSLSLQCRYNGHCRLFYSVAEHSVRAANKAKEFGVDPRYVFLHDAAEAYCGDIIRDIKPAVFDDNVESKIRNVIFCYFGLTTSYWDTYFHVIKQIDNMMLSTEVRDLMPKKAAGTFPSYDVFKGIIIPWNYRRAKDEFLMKAKELGLRD